MQTLLNAVWTPLERVVRRARRCWSAISQAGTGGLVQSGDWRCRYEDGRVTRWLSHGDADNMRELHGGTLEWRHDTPNVRANLTKGAADEA